MTFFKLYLVVFFVEVILKNTFKSPLTCVLKMKNKTYNHIYTLDFLLLTYTPFNTNNYLNSETFMVIVKAV